MLLNIAIVCAAPLVVFGLGYLAGCAAAERWLTFSEWWGTDDRIAKAMRSHPATHCEHPKLRCRWPACTCGLPPCESVKRTEGEVDRG